jgi:hypothetical protein
MSPDVRITADRRSDAAGTAAFKPVANVWRMVIRAMERETVFPAPDKGGDTLFRYGKVLLRPDSGAFRYTRRLQVIETTYTYQADWEAPAMVPAQKGLTYYGSGT